MGLSEFLGSAQNFVARERLLHMKASFEMKLHAAASEEQLKMTEPEIDNDGYDFAVSLRNYHLYVQNKATIAANIGHWEVHPILLQASFCDRDIAPVVDGRPVWGAGEGASGAVLLHIIDRDAASCGNLLVSYRYFDIFYAGAVAVGLYDVETFSRDQAKKLLQQIQTGKSGERLRLPITAFLPIRSPAAMIALRFHLPSPTNYVSVVRKACESAERGEDLKILGKLWNESVAPWVV